jgi:uncharacterized membrane protein
MATWALLPLVRAPLFASSDGVLHLYQFQQFDAAFRGGAIYPRWAPDLLSGYGYPIFTFVAPLLFFIGTALHTAGLNLPDALKGAIGAGIVGSLLGMYVLGRELWGRWGGFIAAAAYIYVPYRLFNTYMDGEFAQTLAWAWLPWLVWACWRYTRGRPARFAGPLVALCYAGLVYTHPLMSWLGTMLLAVLLLGWLLLRQVRFSRLLKVGGWLALGAGAAAP